MKPPKHLLIKKVLLLSLIELITSVKNINFKNCKEKEYYDIVKLGCVQCPSNQTSNAEDNHFSCKCGIGFVPIFKNNTMICKQCPKNHTTSVSGLACVGCPGNKFNETSRKCEKCSGNNVIAIDQFLNGSSTGFVKCVKCMENFVADHHSKKCIPCHWSFYSASDGSCTCPTATHKEMYGICVSNIDIASTGIIDRKSSYVINFNAGEYESKLLFYYYKISAYGCKYLKDSSYCHLLTNLCTLLHYSYDNELNVCSYYRATYGEKGINLPRHVPLLYYDSAEHVSSSFSLKANLNAGKPDPSTNTVDSKLNFIIAEYSLEGKILQFDTLQNVISFCPGLIPLSMDSFDIGNSVHSKCRVDSKVFFESNITRFYELFLQYRNGKELKIQNIPVLNLNFKLNNVKVNLLDKGKWQFVKKFFLIDNLSGEVRSKEEDDHLPIVVQFADSIEIVMELQENSSDGLMNLPYVKVHYQEVLVEKLKSLTYINVSFKIEYLGSSPTFFKILSVANGIAGTLATLLALTKAWSISRRGGKYGVDCRFLLHFIPLVFGYISNCFFFIISFMSCVWVVLFKFQDVVWTFLPNADHDFVIKQYMISAFFLKIVHVVYVLYNQITIDLFLVDWEQPKSPPPNYILQETSKHTFSSKKDCNVVSIWRTYFIANEWNELQTHRKVNVPLVLFIMIFYLKVLNYESVCKYSIFSSDNISLDNTPFSYVLRLTICVFMFSLLSFVQSLFHVAIYERFIENKLEMFIDMCSIANISVLIFKHNLYGFYIHGRSVYGEADLNMQSLNEQLKKEEEDLCQNRGLEPSNDCQTFQVRVTHKFRESYDAILGVFEDKSTIHPRNRNLRSKKKEFCIEAHERIKNFLSIFLQHGLKGLNFVVKEKLFLETALDVEFQEPKDESLFFRDHRHSFDKVLLYGEEMVLLTFELLVFLFVDIIATDFILASIITYMVHSVLKTLRVYGGKRNVAQKTLVDERFLL